MHVFTALSAGSFRLTGSGKPVTAFPASAKEASADTITLIAVPEEDRTPGVISWPGEYSTGGMAIRGVGHEEGRQVSFVIDTGGVHIGILSSPLRDWTDKEIESVPGIDVLVLPADDAKLAQKLVDEFDPRILLLLPGKDTANVEKAVGAKEKVAEYKLKASLPAEGREVYLLEA